MAHHDELGVYCSARHFKMIAASIIAAIAMGYAMSWGECHVDFDGPFQDRWRMNRAWYDSFISACCFSNMMSAVAVPKGLLLELLP